MLRPIESVLAIELLNLLQIVIQISGEQKQFQVFEGYRMKELENTTSKENVPWTGECPMKCKSGWCTAVSFALDGNVCYVNHYGRVLLIQEPGFTTYALSMLHSHTVINYMYNNRLVSKRICLKLIQNMHNPPSHLTFHFCPIHVNSDKFKTLI